MTAAIELVYTEPEVTTEYLESVLFRDLIGECSTTLYGSSNRINNITLSSDAIDGTILEPGEVFSFNQIVGRRTAARGYRPGPSYSGGRTVMTIGGGICQVSSTIYSAIRDTDLRVLERHPHGRPVTYLPRGRDATVSWGTLDFRFMNNTDFPLLVDVKITGKTITAQIYGTLTEER